jgi:hypothetical protein
MKALKHKKKDIPAPSIDELVKMGLHSIQKQLREEIAKLPTPQERVKELRETLLAVVRIVPEVRPKAKSFALHIADQIVADVATIESPKERTATLREMLAFYENMAAPPATPPEPKTP